MPDDTRIDINITVNPHVNTFVPRIDVQVYGLDDQTRSGVIIQAVNEAKAALDALAKRLLRERMTVFEKEVED